MTDSTPTVKSLIGKLCQYKSDHYGKIIFTDWDTSDPPYIRNDGYTMPPLSFQASYTYTVPNAAGSFAGPVTIFSGSFVLPPPRPAPSPYAQPLYQNPPPKRTGKENHKAPWKYGMPWTFYDKLPPTDLPLASFGTGTIDNRTRAKLILTPVETLGFNVKVKNTSTVIASCEYLRCLMTNPKDDTQSVPVTVWVKPDWIEPHTGAETYDADLAKALLGKLRAR